MSSLTGQRPAALAGAFAVVAGVGAIALAWYHMGNTSQVWIQNQELASGGLLGLGLIVFGSALLVRDGVLRAAEVRQRDDVPPPSLPPPVEVPVNGKAKNTRPRVKESV